VTPFHCVPSLDHFVTQWMSTVTADEGRARKSFQRQVVSSFLWTSRSANDQAPCGVRGVGPAAGVVQGRAAGAHDDRIGLELAGEDREGD